MSTQAKAARAGARQNGVGRLLTALVLGTALHGTAVAAGPQEELERTRVAMAAAAREYRATLEPVIGFRTEAAARADRIAAERRALLEMGVVSRRQVEESEQAAEAAHRALESAKNAMADAERLLVEAEVMRQLAAIPAPAPGETREMPTVSRHLGMGSWSLAMAPQIDRFFREHFGRPAPFSAFGQTPLHDRLGFDHRNAIDVAVHPESAEGQLLVTWLRERGISFLAFRGAVPGESTGAHIHVGEASPRLLATPR